MSRFQKASSPPFKQVSNSVEKPKKKKPMKDGEGYKCPICGYKGDTKQALWGHMKMHNRATKLIK